MSGTHKKTPISALSFVLIILIQQTSKTYNNHNFATSLFYFILRFFCDIKQKPRTHIKDFMEEQTPCQFKVIYCMNIIRGHCFCSFLLNNSFCIICTAFKRTGIWK